MLKVLVKANERTPRFKTLQSFSDLDIDAAFRFAEEQGRVYWAVQVKSNAGPLGTWRELQTKFNPHALSL